MSLSNQSQKRPARSQGSCYQIAQINHDVVKSSQSVVEGSWTMVRQLRSWSKSETWYTLPNMLLMKSKSMDRNI